MSTVELHQKSEKTDGKQPVERRENDLGKPPERKSVLDWPWPVIVSIVGLVSLGVAYSLGDAYYNAYLAKFSIEPTAFPIDKARHLVLSLYGALNTIANVQAWLTGHTVHVLKLVALILLGVAVWVLIEKGLLWAVERASRRADGSTRSIKLWPIAVRFFTIVFWIWTTVGIGSILGMSVPTVMAIPSLIGEFAGNGVASDQMRDYDRGCWVSEARCQMVVKGGKEVARGYIVAQSATHIALYYEGNTVQMPLDGSEIRTVERPNFDHAMPR
ncbi:hypothetical protein WJ12_05505 [Burkholderia seminalis]|uniref:hypothetical protein n=1 Tax=Burkholderia seminalis TaxID=488731 RepID=UPI000841BC21|nr:hypothetical protein [Burkholderia seminalis]AOJ24330.1 hypothetical protein WJ12_05505 [Burkholderia seminalis]